MRIGYLVPEFPSQTHIFFWREIQALERLGADVHLLSTRVPPKPSRHAFAAAAQKRTRYLFPPRFARSCGYLLSRPNLLIAMLRYVVEVEETSWKHKVRLLGLILCAAELLQFATDHKLDHVHGHSCADVAHLLALASLAGQLPYSLTLHSDLGVYGTGHASKFRHASFVSVVTFALQKQVHETLGIPLEKLPVIRMGVDIDRFRVLVKERRKGEELRILTVARLDDCKGHIFALQAMRMAMDQGLKMYYTIVGEGSYRTAIEAEVERLQLQQHVHLTGTASEDEVLGYLQDGDAFVLPSVGFGEAAPVSVMEAMACGLPIVSSIIGGTPELITDGADGFLVPQRDVSGFARAFSHLAQDKALRARMGAHARLIAETRFSAHKFAVQFLGVIRKSKLSV